MDVFIKKTDMSNCIGAYRGGRRTWFVYFSKSRNDMVLKYNITKRGHILLIDRVHMTDVILTKVWSARSRRPLLTKL